MNESDVYYICQSCNSLIPEDTLSFFGGSCPDCGSSDVEVEEE